MVRLGVVFGMLRRTSPLLLALVVAFALSACAPRLSPPYRDYEARTVETDLTQALREAAVAAGWEIVPGLDSAIVATAPRPFGSSLTSRTEASVEMVPLGRGFVRVAIRAEQRSKLFGGRSKVYALDRDLREAVLADLTEALRERGLVPLGTPRDRDEDATE